LRLRVRSTRRDMSNCCSDTECEIEVLRSRQRNVLVAVLAINAIFFAVESVSGLLASSTALVADSLDMLGDALVYGFSLYVVRRDDLWKARSARLKGSIMAAFGALALAQALYKVLHPEVPSVPIIGVVGLFALAANAFCFGLLWRHRADDINMRSVWLCSRNDIIANVAVLGAAIGVAALGSQWPDVLVGVGIAALFLRSAVTVLRDAANQRSAMADEPVAVPTTPTGKPVQIAVATWSPD
jgi:Co/Zn/Cd efflux system component